MSDRRPVVGQPCPNPDCPKGNPPVSRWWWVNNFIMPIGVISGLSILTILYFDIAGWGTFASTLAIAILVQFAFALILFGVFIAALRTAFQKFFRAYLSGWFLHCVLFLAIILALPLLAIIFRRAFDIYDVLQSLIIEIISIVFLSKPLGHLAKWLDKT